MRDDAKLVHGLKGQMRHFASSLLKGLSAAASRAVSDVFYGLCKGGAITLTSIGRGLKERTKLENIVERISRNLSKKDMSKSLNRRLVAAASSKISQDSLLVPVQSDIQKRYGRSMEYLGRVRDGTSGKTGAGYWNLNIVATKDFKCYAIADGLKEVLSSTTKPWREPKPPPSHQTTILFAAIEGGSLM